jgi:DnaK suppressor protein
MTEQIEGLIQVLEDKRTEVARAICSETSHLSLCESEHELTDHIQGMCRRDGAATLLSALTRTLVAVEAALDAVRQGSYGICVDCGEHIASRRLQTIPWASHCIRCQELVEECRDPRAAALRWADAA